MKLFLAGIAAAGLAIAVTLAGVTPAHATVPGTNGLIAFQVEGNHGNRIYTVEPDGSHLRLVTTGTADAQSPDWSPDGEWIVFTKNGCKIALIHPDGTDLHRIELGASCATGTDRSLGVPARLPRAARSLSPQQ